MADTIAANTVSCPSHITMTVSYTQLDVYKRQPQHKTKLIGRSALLGTTLIWGSSFIIRCV